MSIDRSVPRIALRTAIWRDLARFACEALAAGLIVSLVLALAAFIVSAQAQAATNGAPGAGELRLRSAARDAPLVAPLLATDVEIDVAGITARARVTQRFRNPTQDWKEGVYVFPLPENAAVDHLDMRIGNRQIEGKIQERKQAKQTYEQAKQEGRKATLVEQERPNVFTTSVANIGPDEEIAVSIEYQQTLRYDDGRFRLRFPMVVAPRYIAGNAAVVGIAGTGWGVNTDGVSDAERITPPVVHPSEGTINPVTLTVTLNAGFPLAELLSPYHPIDVVTGAENRYHVMLANDAVPADRDFELVWTPQIGRAPQASLLTESRDGRTYALLMVMPPSATADAPRVPREVVYIIDTSGSMEGTSIVQAKAALSMALDRLQPGDRFNVIEFNSVTRALFGAPMPVDPATIGQARSFVSKLHARGGTEMKPALEAALTREAAPGFVRQVVFLTDGAVGNETELIALIGERLGDRRLFTVGIGSAPNAYFMTKAAQFGRGTYTYIGDVREVADKMSALFRKLESPVLTDLAVTWPNGAEAFPRQVPDLYAGEPVVVTAMMDAPSGDVTVSGRRGDMPWQARVPLAADGIEPGMGVLWARAKIEALTDAMKGGETEADIRPAIVDLALAHHLVSQFTSLVAVDVTPTALPGTVPTKSALATNLPQGMSYEAVFGGLPQTATPAPLMALVGLVALLIALVAWRARTRMAVSP